MARTASEMFKNMSPEEMDRMMEMASKMQPGMGAATSSGGRAGRAGGASASAGPTGAPDMTQAMEAMKDPATMKMMTEMMKNISPEALASMSSAAGMKMSTEDVRSRAQRDSRAALLCWSDEPTLPPCAQAAKLAEQMQNMKPEHLEKLLAVGTALQGGLARVRRMREWVARNSVLVAALLVLLLAFLVRRWLARRSAADAGAARMLHTATKEVCLCIVALSIFARMLTGCCSCSRRSSTAWMRLGREQRPRVEQAPSRELRHTAAAPAKVTCGARAYLSWNAFVLYAEPAVRAKSCISACERDANLEATLPREGRTQRPRPLRVYGGHEVWLRARQHRSRRMSARFRTRGCG